MVSDVTEVTLNSVNSDASLKPCRARQAYEEKRKTKNFKTLYLPFYLLKIHAENGVELGQ